MTPRRILEIVEQHFPIANMDDGFTGAHNLFLNKETGQLVVLVWTGGWQYAVIIFGAQEDEQNEEMWISSLESLKVKAVLIPVEAEVA